MLSILYNLFIMPIQIIVEITYSFMCRFLGNKGIALIGVSLIIQTLILPLYKRSDALQDEEREKQEQMSHWVNHIKKTFKGDEKFMMLNTYYRQQNYKTYYSLKSSFSILLQVPFFLAAYNYLSNLQELRGVSFWFINDLGSPDKSLVIAGFAINVLPIAMTLFNIISGIIYTKGLPFKAKFQVYALAAVFLVLLYNSPAGLVFYWTMNNLYSLLKNVFMKLLKHPLEDLCVIICAACVGLSVYLGIKDSLSTLRLIALIALALIVLIPTIAKHRQPSKNSFGAKCMARLDNLNLPKGFFLWEMILLTVLLGFLIPISVVSTSASEFIVESNSPINVVINAASIYAGFFIVWFSIFYYLMPAKARKIFTIGIFALAGTAILNYMAFNKSYGTMTAMLVYTKGMEITTSYALLNFLAVLATFAILVCAMFLLPKISKYAVQILTIALLVLACINLSKAKTNLNQYASNNSRRANDNIVSLSTEGQNVVVIMLDRAINGYAPYIFDEDPALKEKFDGFTYYPNTLSYGIVTNIASPALFGGYEYTPTAINERSDEALVDKHDEALKLMPALFNNEGYNVTICDPPYAGYLWNSDLTIYNDYENVHAYISEGAFDKKNKDYIESTNNKAIQESNFVYYSLMKVLPLRAQEFVYNDGDYFTTARNSSGSSLTAVSDTFMNNFTSIISLKDMTKIVDDNSNNFFLYQNCTTHEPTVLSTPDYVPSDDIDENAELDKFNNAHKTHNGVELSAQGAYTLSYYHVNMASYKALGEWFDYLKENGVYDNTRIIIVSDHAWGGLGQFDYMTMDIANDSKQFEVMGHNPILMIKDFNAKGFTTSDEFMTNADVPTYAVKDVIANPINPFTGNKINNSAKFNKPHIITTSTNYDTEENNGNVFDTSDGVWYEFNGNNIFNPTSWKLKSKN